MATSTAIQHPNIIYSTSWSSNYSLDNWNNGNTVRTINNNPVKKTIYSPSPIGFSEPKTAAFTGFTTTGGTTTNTSQFNVSGGFNKGWNFYCQPMFQGSTIFFSALGFRIVNTCAISAFGGVGFYWSAGPSSSTNYALHLYFDSGLMLPRYEYPRASGFSVRPVLE